MDSRRRFLTALAAGAGAGALLGRASAPWAAKLKHPLNGPVGLELYSLREMFKKDVPGTLAKVKAMGFTEVEVAGVPGTFEELAPRLKKAGLTAPSAHFGFDKLNGDMPSVIKDAKALGLKWAATAWIPHAKGKFTKDDATKVIDLFPKWGKALKAEGMRFAYHIHGFEFEPSPDGTLMDTIIKNTPADLVDFEFDVFWVRRGGEDPVKLLERYPGRFPLFHLKDIAKGVEICKPNGGAPDETSVPLGQGMIDWPGVLRAAVKGGTQIYYIEDEHPEAFKQIPQSLAYLRALKL